MASDPPIAPSIKVIKRFTYRGVTRDWSNRYFFTDLVPADNTKWTTFSDAVVAAEKAMLPSGGTGLAPIIVGTVGYDAGSDVGVFSKAYSVNGTLAPSTQPFAPGDCAMLVRYGTSSRTSKNHPIYLFNYYHSVLTAGTSTGDTVYSSQVTAAGTYAAAWVTGFSDGSVTHKRCGPQGHTAIGYVVATYVHHRDF